MRTAKLMTSQDEVQSWLNYRLPLTLKLSCNTSFKEDDEADAVAKVEDVDNAVPLP